MLLTLPLVLSWFSALVLALLDGRRYWVGVVAIGLQLAVLAALLALLTEVVQGGARELVTGGWPVGIGIRLRADLLGLLFAIVSTVVVLAALFYEVSHGVVSSNFPTLVLFLGVGLNGLFLTADIFNFYVFFEISMVSAFALASYGEERTEIRTAAIFAIVNLLGSTFLLISVAALYRVTGTLDMAGIASGLAEGKAPLVIAALLFTAFSLKLGLYPFHYWLPAVYRGARPAVTAILAGALANIGSYGLLRFGAEVLPSVLESAQPILLLLGAASILYGGVVAVGRQPAAEALAYSSIGQVGYILLALAMGGSAGFTAAVFYSVANALNKVALFLAVGLRGGMAAVVFAVGAFSVAGVPPSAGFWAKLVLFQASLSSESHWLPMLILAGGALSFIYMFQAYQRLFWIGNRPQPTGPPAAHGLVLALAGLIVVIGIWPEPLLILTQQAATGLTVAMTAKAEALP